LHSNRSCLITICKSNATILLHASSILGGIGTRIFCFRGRCEDHRVPRRQSQKYTQSKLEEASKDELYFHFILTTSLSCRIARKLNCLFVRLKKSNFLSVRPFEKIQFYIFSAGKRIWTDCFSIDPIQTKVVSLVVTKSTLRPPCTTE
jgi:hypothetical protein